MADWESVKKARLELEPTNILVPPPQQSQQPPFSRYFSNSYKHNQKHPILTDKKLIVYDLKVDRPDLPSDYEANAWNRLERAVHAIQRNQPSPESLEVLYQLCENLCQYDKAEQLYERLYQECHQYIQIQFEMLASNSQQGIPYLQNVHELWKNYCDQMSQIRCLFLYLDCTYIASTTKSGSIWNMAMDMFRQEFKTYDIVWTKVLESILYMIKSERMGESIDESFLQLNIRMLMDLDLYHSAFEQHLLTHTRHFYDQEGDRLLESIDIFDYLGHVSTRVHQESILRVKSYFDKSTKSYLQSIVEKELLTKRVENILAKCFGYFQSLESFQDSDYDKFSLLYRLLQKVDKLEICSKYFTNYVKTKGSSILCAKINVQEKITLLSAFESQMDEVVDHSFEGDDQFADGLKDGVEYFINLRENNAIKLLAKHTDQVLRNPVFDEEHLDKGMFLFRYIQGKDAFEIIYKRDLAKRLLLNLSNKNTERIMLTKMKKECGAGYTGKLEGMVKDIEKSMELMAEFNTTEIDDSSLNINVNLLTYGFWPTYIPVNVNLPPMFMEAQNAYRDFYMSKFEKRVLTWQNSLGVCEVTANYPHGTKHITLTLLQTIILLLFNDQSALSFTDILNYSQLDELELRRALVSLSCRKHKLLIKYPEGEDIKPTDQFRYNLDFISDQDQFSMTTATLSEVIEKDSTLDTTILFSREQQLDAVIVRIMKSKSTLSHGLLLSEVTRIVRFPVTAQEIKKRIEILIDKEYLERGPDDDSYSYLA